MPVRAINHGEGADAGRHRQSLYQRCIAQYNEALGAEFYIEAVAIVESLLCDRLESRLAALHGQEENKRRFSTLGRVACELKGQRLGEPADTRGIYGEISKWASQRNKVIHQLVKLEEGEIPNWDDRYKQARRTAEAGMDLFRRLDRVLKALTASFTSHVDPLMAGTSLQTKDIDG